MLILAFDTSTSRGSLALVADDRLLAEYTLESRASYLHRLMVGIDQLLADTGYTLSDVELIVVSSGPGNFTGLRLGLATAKGLALAQGCSVIGINTLDALAANLPFCPYPICPILDAKKHEIYAAFYDGGEGWPVRQGDYLLIAPAALAGRLETPTVLTGPGLERYGSFFHEEVGDIMILPPPELRHVRASVLARLGLASYQAGQIPDVDTLTPFYLRPADAEIRKPGSEAPAGPGG